MEKIFAKDMSDKELLYKIYKKLLKHNNKKTTQLENAPKALTDISSKILRWQISISKDAPGRDFSSMAAWEDFQVSPHGGYNKLDRYNSTKDFLLNTQICLRHQCIKISEGRHIWAKNWAKAGEKERQRQKPCEGPQPCACHGPSRHNSTVGFGCSFPWVDQTRGAETAIRPGWLAHIEPRPKVRSRETV